MLFVDLRWTSRDTKRAVWVILVRSPCFCCFS